jgi:hypothetical protein
MDYTLAKRYGFKGTIEDYLKQREKRNVTANYYKANIPERNNNHV